MTGTSGGTWLEPQEEGIPILPASPLTQPFWDGCAGRALRYQRCLACGAANFNPAYVCRMCTSNQLDWTDSSGRGSIFSYTICHRPMTPQFTDVYAPVIIDLEEGYQMLSNLIGCNTLEIRVGMAVTVVFHDVGERTLPYFVPA